MIIAIVLTIIYALWEAKGDYDDIEGGVFINHVQRWLTRATIAGVFGFFLWGPFQLLAIAMLFSAVFRYELNRRRGMNPFYVAPWSNFYDRVFYSIVLSRWLSKGEAFLVERNYYSGEYTEDIYDAGKVAYVVEAVLVVMTILAQ